MSRAASGTPSAVELLVPTTSIGIARLFQIDDDDTRKALNAVAANQDRQFWFALLGTSASSRSSRRSSLPPALPGAAAPS